MKILTLSEVKHDQVRYPEGSVLELGDEAAENLINLGVAQEATDEDEEIAKVKAKSRAKGGKGAVKTETKKVSDPDEEFTANESFSTDAGSFKKRVSNKGNVQFTANGRLIKKEAYDKAYKQYLAENKE